MKIDKLPNGIEITVESHELVDHFLKLALKQVKNKKPYQYSTAYATSFRIDVRFIETPSKSYLKKRKIMLEKADKIKLVEFTEEFRKTGNKNNQRLISQFCNIFRGWKDETLKYLLERDKADMLKFRRVGPKALDLFEKFLNGKGFEFAIWNGEKWV